MKKKLAALLCGVMCVGAFTGCSDTELAYLKMSKDMMDTMAACRVEGSMEADVDLDALQDFIADIAAASGSEADPLLYNGEELSGKKTVDIDYDMHMNIDTLEYDMSFEVEYEGKKYDLGTMYYSLNKGIFVTADTLMGVYQMAGDLMEGYEDHYVMSDAFAKDFKQMLAEEKYIELISVQDLTGWDTGAAMPEMDYGDLYDAAFKFYEDVLKGFETDMVKAVDGGYEIQADGREAAELLVNLLYFIAENPEQVLDATEAYMMSVVEQVPVGTAEEAAAAEQEMAALFAEARASQADFVAAAEQFAIILEGLLADASVGMVLDSFSYEADVKKVGDGFVTTGAYVVSNDGKEVCSLKETSTMKKYTAALTFPQSGMTVEELEEKMEALENKYNPVTGVSVTWGWEPEGREATVYTMRAEEVIFGGGTEWTDLVIQEGRAYLPLRLIAESLGEEVGWDKSTKTPYVMQDGQRVDMKGLLQDSKAFVGVRDFEKLGYTVTYIPYEDGMKEALIER